VFLVKVVTRGISCYHSKKRPFLPPLTGKTFYDMLYCLNEVLFKYSKDSSWKV